MARPETKQQFKFTNEVADQQEEKNTSSHLIVKVKSTTNRVLAAMDLTCLRPTSIPGSLNSAFVVYSATREAKGRVPGFEHYLKPIA